MPAIPVVGAPASAPSPLLPSSSSRPPLVPRPPAPPPRARPIGPRHPSTGGVGYLVGFVARLKVPPRRGGFWFHVKRELRRYAPCGGCDCSPSDVAARRRCGMQRPVGVMPSREQSPRWLGIKPRILCPSKQCMSLACCEPPCQVFFRPILARFVLSWFPPARRSPRRGPLASCRLPHRFVPTRSLSLASVPVLVLPV